jgi:hypothetical protein
VPPRCPIRPARTGTRVRTCRPQDLGIEEKPAAFQASWRLACLDAGRAQDAVPSHGEEHETVSVDLGVDRARVRLDQTAYREHRSEVGGNVQLEVERHVLVVMAAQHETLTHFAGSSNMRSSRSESD